MMIPRTDSFVVANNIMNSLIRKQFGDDFKIRIDSIIYYQNRDYRNGFKPTCVDKIYLITPPYMKYNLIKKIHNYLLEKLNDFSKCYDYDNYVKIDEINLIIK